MKLIGKIETNPGDPLANCAHEAFAQRVAKGLNQSAAYREVYPKSRRWRDKTVHEFGSRLASKVSARIDRLQSQAADAAICSIIERKRILSEIARGNVADYVTAGKDGTWIDFGPESKNPHAVQAVKSRTTEDSAAITTLAVHDPVAAIDLLNKMDGLYRDTNNNGTTVIVVDIRKE
jgi:hypothetical protein